MARKTPAPRRASPVADRKLLEAAAKDAARWKSRLDAGLTARDRSRPAVARDEGGAEIPTSALPEAVRSRVEAGLYSGDGEP